MAMSVLLTGKKKMPNVIYTSAILIVIFHKLQNDFTDLSEVWNHFDAGSCSGQAIGVRIRLKNVRVHSNEVPF